MPTDQPSRPALRTVVSGFVRYFAKHALARIIWDTLKQIVS